jgi:putative membrane protein
VLNAAATAGATVPGWHPHFDVWLVMLLSAGGYLAALRYLGPKRVAPGEPVATRRQMAYFLSGVAILWIGADWPLHEVSEKFLFSAHMVQHTLFSLVAPPLLLLGIPAWLYRAIIDAAGLNKVVKLVTKPAVGLITFNLVIVGTHWPTVVGISVHHHLAHFGLHVILFTASVLMWWPVVDPLPEYSRLSPPGKMLYLFLQSILPTVPASFLTFSDAPLYSFYAHAPRLWGLDAITDQRIAGLFMKIGGGLLLWLAIAILFFRWNAAEERSDAGEATEVSWEDFERELEAWELRKT